MGTLRDLQFALQLKIEELRQRDTLIDELELELDAKDELIRRLRDELDRYRASVSLPGAVGASAASSAPSECRAERRTIICESVSLDPLTLDPQRSCCDKNQTSQSLIQAACLKSGLLKHLDQGEIRAVASCVYPATIHQGGCVVQEGTTGAQAYILEEGRMEVTRDGARLRTMEPEDVFGESSLLYGCTHSSSLSALTDSRLWVLDSRSYRSVLVQSGLSRLSRTVELLSSVPFLQPLADDVIMRMCDVTVESHYSEGDYITRQGATGETFFIISRGQVKVTEKKSGQEEQTLQARLSEGQWFGENALWGEGLRTVSVVALGPVTCLEINRQPFRDLLDSLVFNSCDEVQHRVSTAESDLDVLLSSSTLSDFHIVHSLAVGEFGHVDLVRLKSLLRCVFTMKVLKKKLVEEGGQRQQVLREGRILLDAHCPFVVRLHRLFRDGECLYMLTESCLGGDLSSLLPDKGCLDECSARFYVSCLVEALTFLHGRGVVHRDVKPQNVVLDEQGYAKLTGSRCMKQVLGKRTWTFCGTPGYMAPEVMLGRGHGAPADLWSLGVFVFELLSGGLPFNGSDPMTILTATIGGIDHVDFPENMSTSASSLIRALCRSGPSERPTLLRNGAKDVHKHKWFEELDWEALRNRTMTAPVIPKVEPPTDAGECSAYTVDPVELSADWDHF